MKAHHQNTSCYQILPSYLKKQQSYKGGHNGPPYRSVFKITHTEQGQRDSLMCETFHCVNFLINFYGEVKK